MARPQVRELQPAPVPFFRAGSTLGTGLSIFQVRDTRRLSCLHLDENIGEKRGKGTHASEFQNHKHNLCVCSCDGMVSITTGDSVCWEGLRFGASVVDMIIITIMPTWMRGLGRK